MVREGVWLALVCAVLAASAGADQDAQVPAAQAQAGVGGGQQPVPQTVPGLQAPHMLSAPPPAPTDHLIRAADAAVAGNANPNPIQQIHKAHYDQMHPLAMMATQGMLPEPPPFLVSGHKPGEVPQPAPGVQSANIGAGAPASGIPGLLPPPLLPSGGNKGPSPQFQEMMKRLEKENGGKLPPGLGAFASPPPLPGMQGQQPRLGGAPAAGSAAGGAGGAGGAAAGGAGAGNQQADGAPILPALALPREVPQQPKGPSIAQIMQIQKQHQQFVDNQHKKDTAQDGTGAGQGHEHKGRGGAGVDEDFRSPFVDQTVDDWIDQEISKKSEAFKRRLGHAYRKRQERIAKRGGVDDGHTAKALNDYDPDGTVFLSKVSNVLSTEHPDMGSRLDRWIDKQVNAAMDRHTHHRHHDSDEDDDGDVWLQDALENSEESEDDHSNELLARDFARGVFYSPASQNRKEFGTGNDKPAHRVPRHAQHRKFKRRKLAGSQQVLLQVSGPDEPVRYKKLQRVSDEHVFGREVHDHNLNFDPSDNRFRVDRDTNVEDPDYTAYPMHKIIEKHRKLGRKDQRVKDALGKWTDIATGRDKDPLEGLFPGSRFDFADPGLQTQDFDLDAIVRAFEDERRAPKEDAPRFSAGWGL